MKTRLLFPAVCAAAFIGNPAMADGDKAHADLSSWDSDSDKMVTQQEWADSFDANGLFDRIDKNKNGNFDVDESIEGVAEYDLSMDLDAGGTISREEFVVGLYKHLDANGDDRLDESEWDTFASASEGSTLWADDADSAEN